MKKYQVGYTTGVFDLFHVGHLNILQKSKELCNYLIVGVSTDELVRSYKNKTPVITLENRMKIVESIKYVDKVVVQGTMNKLDAWEQLKFEVMFHGDDWKNTTMWKEYEEKFKKVGVDLVYFPYTRETSSTILKSKILI
ncbi:adenylyltransferase/cytidyltransferase family protein [Neobacillus mesonae]|uniref:adenylyltransferase/cytidyltransferase family protein n=1 Tax=Neobacillus mesonae TaxID=1193713 RepID=UPI00203A4C5C|nr:adenylyltransferase/cytidyltransferase family protein [Neobacillus mesonae]MCM3568225.1 adenylyltransferase/cytidyltransferase family protein [Neobacillus mesonae]